MNLHRSSIGVLFLALFGLMAMPSSAQAQQQDQEQDSLAYERLYNLLEADNSQTYRFAQLDAENIRVVNVESIMSGLDDTQRQRLRELYKNVEKEGLRNAIENSPTIKDALRNEGNTQIDAMDVIALEMQDGGQIVAYVDPNHTLRDPSMDDSQNQEDEWEDRTTSETEDLQQPKAQQGDRDSSQVGETQQQNPQIFERLHSALHDMKAQTQALMETNDQRIRIVHVEDVFAELDDALIQRLRVTYQNVDTNELHSALENQEAIKSALNTETGTQDLSDVVAVDVRDNGATIVYVDTNDQLESDETGDYE